MKKIISLLLAASMILGASLVLSGCRKTVKGGTEAAKLLLANERLDENLIAQKIDVGINSIDPNNKLMASPLFYSISPLKSTAAKSWSDFPAYNDTASQFSSFILNIDNQAKFVAEDIANMKNDVGVVDKWVEVGREKHMLRVYDKKDVLFVINEFGDINAYYRYTDENANNVYEMYSFNKYDDGSTGEIRTLYIPGSRYEFQYINDNGFEDYVIMENSRGYWIGNRYNYSKNDTGRFVRFTPIIIKDDFCYSATVEYGTYVNGVTDYTVVDLISGSELISIYPSEHSASFTLHASGIKDGLVSVGADEYEVFDGAYMTGQLTELITDNGVFKSIYEEESDDAAIGFTGGDIGYDFLYNVYKGHINMSIRSSGKELDSTFTQIGEILEKYGLTLQRSLGDIREQMAHAYALGNDFAEVFEWNGYKLDGIESFESARGVLTDTFKSVRAEYESIKNYETATGRQKLDRRASFAPVSMIRNTENSYTDGTITIGNTTVEISDTALFESGKQYVLKVALSLLDEDGNPISVNTVPLSGGESPAVTLNGDSIALMASGSYAVPKNLIAGDYALVVYAATADEEIRVSEMLKIGSFSTYSEKLESAAMDITVKTVDGNLHLVYAIKNSHTVELASGGRSYTSDEIERIITTEILKKGAPFSGAVLEYADGTAVADADTLGEGTYRMMCYLGTADGLAQSYVYLVIE